MSIDVCALNLVTEGGPEWTELLRDSVDSDPNILTDLLSLSLTYAPHLVSRLLYGGQFQFARYLTANEVGSNSKQNFKFLGIILPPPPPHIIYAASQLFLIPRCVYAPSPCFL